MAAIPTYQRQAAVQGDLPAARADTSVQADDAIGRSMQGLGQQGMALSTSIMRVDAQQAAEAKKKAEDQAAVDVSNVLSSGDVYWQENVTTATKNWKVGDPDLRETIGKSFDDWANQNTEKLPTDASKKFFQQHAASMKSRLQTGVFTYQEKARTAKLDADTSVGMQADENVVFNDPKRFDEVYRRRMEPMIARSDLTEADKIAAAGKYKRQLSLAVERGQMERDPAAWYKERFGEYKAPGAMPAAGASAGGEAIPTKAGSVPAALWAAQIGQESGGKQFSANGKPLTSPKGAIGVAQVMPGTAREAAALAGLPYDERRYQQDASYNEKLGQAYMAKQLETFGGDQAKALAAYNMGPGSTVRGNGVAGLVKRWGDQWLAHAPAETQDYVKKIMGKASRGGGVQTESVDTGVKSDAGNGQPAPAVVPPATFSGMDWEQQSALKARAETMMKQSEAQFRASADRAVADAIAMHKDGVMDPQQLQPEFFERAYGGEGARMYGEYQESREMGSDIGKFKTQSEGEIAAEIQAAEPKPGEGYASADTRRNIRVQAAQQVLQARKADPAGYVVSTNESLAKQRQALDNPQTPAEQRPAMVQKFVAESLAEQQRLGIRAPAVLTPGQADAIAKRAMGATRPEDSANLISGLEAEYGGYFPKVFGELVKSGAISGELLLIPNLPSQTAREAVSRLARVKESDLSNGIDTKVQKDVKDAVTMKLGEFTRAVPFPNDQASGVISAYETSMRKLAYQFVLSGQDGTTATDSAHKMLLGHYQFDETMRVPRSVDLSATKRGAAYMLDKDLKGIDVPTDLVGARKPEELADEWQSTVRSRPMWFTNDDDKGLTLYAQGNDGVRYKVTRGGKPVTYSWLDLAGRVSKGGGRQASGSVTYPGIK